MKLGFAFGAAEVAAIWRILKIGWGHLAVPKNAAGKVGIVIALKTEKSKEELRLKNDLVAELRASLSGHGVGHLFQVIQFRPQLCGKIIDEQVARRYLYKSRSHFIVYGSLFERKINNELSYVFRLHGIVRHNPIDVNISKRISKEFRTFLPLKIAFSEGQEVLGFELTEQWLKYVIKYIIGLAALVSGGAHVSLALFDELTEEVNHTANAGSIPVLEEMKKRLPDRQIDALSGILLTQYLEFASTRNPDYIIASKQFSDRVIALDKNHFSARVMRAMYHFFQDDLDKAILEFKQMESKEPACHYNLGFLLAYKGDITGALEEYRRTFHKAVPANIITDTELFISDVIEKHPEKVHLRFFRGLINYKAKADYRLALEDFDYFLNNVQGESYQRLADLAKNYVFEIRTNLGL